MVKENITIDNIIIRFLKEQNKYEIYKIILEEMRLSKKEALKEMVNVYKVVEVNVINVPYMPIFIRIFTQQEYKTIK